MAQTHPTLSQLNTLPFYKRVELEFLCKYKEPLQVFRFAVVGDCKKELIFFKAFPINGSSAYWVVSECLNHTFYFEI